ncbi:aspartyl protease family protein [Turneriella parva]|uniref:Aspartyl protease n=1 Tax=Turneriella parva (strain ATCC BAA-1111 / DSM 21527 / NCTC 11395 / H) TaxID=869212 RepID=I4B2W9_TURPD|nr:aspartyl protease family protein [Turneriella parva]AFM11626.1 hypothetical protein Turpa_0977 [Turneriella parva DSM 21527]
MGKIMQAAQVINYADTLAQKKLAELTVDFLVDTGAAMLCMPIDLIEKLGLTERSRREVITANGKVQRRVFSPVRIIVNDRDADMNVMELPIGTPPQMGYLVLETLDLYPDPKNQRLTGNPAHDGKMVVDLL